ncbi:DUF3376 domain-containing protein [Kocuria sp. M1R5S2]|uniref:DUF3376 domain-containing protein n=1 Tax=Kocuria rhizosphaerae TaxID=3376285 RepID=UPI0037AE31D9
MNAPRETRFALVLNGGVSLAVWMGGVTHELNRLRLASADASPPADPAEAAVQKAWQDILAATDRTAVVDTVAGTSAGGLNGSLLAAAVAGGKDLPDMRTTWAKLASLQTGQLLREDGSQLRSMLDGAYFHTEVERLLQAVAEDTAVAAPQDCTLLVTATALDAQSVPVQLEDGSTAHMVDSRRVFRFSRRTDDLGEVTDHFDEGHSCIALASRASASFPIAFEPVWETDALHGHQMAPGMAPDNSWLIDGGVLDNAPFGPLMRTLRERPVGTPFERVVLYVTPSPGVSGGTGTLGSSPEATQVLGRVVGAAREPDQRLDFEELSAAFTRMGYTLSVPHDAIVRLLRSPDPEALIDTANAALAASQWFRTYRLSRAEAVERQLMSLNSPLRFTPPHPAALLPEELASVPDEPSFTEDGWGWGVATAERMLRWWGRALVDYADTGKELEQPFAEAFASVERSQRRIARLGEHLTTFLALGPAPTAHERAQRLNAFLTPARQTEIRETLRCAAEAITGLPLAGELSAEDLVNFSLAVEVASSVLSWGSTAEGDEPEFRYRQITPAAPPLVDVGAVTSQPGWLERKLYGQRWGHFGAFASEPGREADWLWGRLDGAGALCDYLLHGVPDRQALERRLADAILAAESTTADGLVQAAASAEAMTPYELLLRMPPEQRRDAVRLLWRQAVTLFGGVGAGDPGVLQLVRAFADPTWTRRDLPAGASLRTRALTGVVRRYGAPARFFVRRRVAKHLDI